MILAHPRNFVLFQSCLMVILLADTILHVKCSDPFSLKRSSQSPYISVFIEVISKSVYLNESRAVITILIANSDNTTTQHDVPHAVH